MNELIKVILLAIIQGIAEFLPISSSGHLAVLGSLVEVDPAHEVQLVVVLHAGTLLAILVFYFKELMRIIKEGNIKLISKIILASVPVGILGLTLHFTGLMDQLFNTILFSGVGFLFTGAMLLYGMKEKEDITRTEMKELTPKQSVIIGLAQALAILPGVSRSGTTISAALKLGIKKEDAATFSFLLAIPAIAGASFVEFISALRKGADVNISPELITNMVIGFIISAIVGYFALKLLLISLKKGKLSIYAYYCLGLGISVILWKSPVIYKFLTQ